MSDCLFCRIIAGEIPSAKVYEDQWVYAFRDIQPQAPVHILVVPRVHMDSLENVDNENAVYAEKCLQAAAVIARQEGLSGGWRLVSNCGPDAGQTVRHLHFHSLGGRKLSDTMA